jgi:hypothetical protein
VVYIVTTEILRVKHTSHIIKRYKPMACGIEICILGDGGRTRLEAGEMRIYFDAL